MIATKPKIQIRLLARRDMTEVMEVEQACFRHHTWTEREFIICMQQATCVGMVAEHRRDKRVVGFMLYERHKARYHILNFAVAPEEQRLGVGTAMLGHLKSKLSNQRPEIQMVVRESSLSAQLFFRSQRFLAIDVWRNYYPDNDEDAYVMSFLGGS